MNKIDIPIIEMKYTEVKEVRPVLEFRQAFNVRILVLNSGGEMMLFRPIRCVNRLVDAIKF